MLNNLVINQRIKFIAFVTPFLWLVFGYYFTTQKVNESTHQKYNEIAKEMQTELKTLIREKEEAILIMAMSVSTNSQIKQVLLNNKSQIKLDDFSLYLRKNTSLKNVWFQIISADGKSLYRSWTKKTGDDLTKARLDVSQMIKNPQVISTVSTGKFDLSFKSMVPIYHKENFIGFIEVIAKFNSIAIKMQEKNYDTIVLVDKKYKDQLKYPFAKIFIDDYYVANINPKKDLLNFIEEKGVKHFINSDKYHTYEDVHKLAITYHLKDIYGEEMGYFILFHNTKNININGTIQTRDRLIVFFILIFIALSALIYYLYTKRYKNFIQRLHDEVINKTQELQRQSDQLEYIAHHDSLTGLPNRLLFFDRLKQSIKHSKRNNMDISVLFLDLDRFKEVNDTFGHDIGDQLLQEVSKKLIHSVREEDTISRLGGDEFTIILEGTDENDVIKITQKIITTMQEKTTINNLDIYTTFSIGISKFPEDGDTPEILLRNADTALYKAKDMGKNQYQFYNQKMTDIAIARSQVEHNLRLAIDNNEFIPYYQPKINAITGTVIGMEALVRWQHPKSGIIEPDKFILIAEETGLIVPIDRWMMRDTIKMMKQWHNDGIKTGKLSLNLSIKQLENDKCVDSIKDIIKEFEFDTKFLELEITESQVMEDPESTIKVLNQIRELGISISVDDFGTGYSSLAYLKQLPIDKLKIDRSFVDNLPLDENDIAIVKAIIALAKSLNLDLIAEGVETKEQLDFLVQEGCVNIQGYYYSKPLPSDIYKEFLLKHQ